MNKQVKYPEQEIEAIFKTSCCTHVKKGVY